VIPGLPLRCKDCNEGARERDDPIVHIIPSVI